MSLEIKRVLQKAGHCGPACIAMLLTEQGIEVSQESVATSAGIASSIQKEGSRVDQLADAVEQISNRHMLLARFDSKIADLQRFLPAFGRPLGIEWQGVFFRDDGSTFEEGHYSLINGYDSEFGRFRIIDPDSRSFFTSGLISPDELARRWWERNSIRNSHTPSVVNRGLIFVVSRDSEIDQFVAEGFKRPTSLDLIAHNVRSEL
jgi:hypothetical protein